MGRMQAAAVQHQDMIIMEPQLCKDEVDPGYMRPDTSSEHGLGARLCCTGHGHHFPALTVKACCTCACAWEMVSTGASEWAGSSATATAAGSACALIASSAGAGC